MRLLPEKRVIVDCLGRPYLTRWYLLRAECFGIFLHRFHRSDEDRALHDHPWNFLTVVLWRGYREITPSGVRRIWLGMILWRPAEWRHRVELIQEKPALTLILRFRARREWGFWEGTKWVQWNRWWQENCE